MKLAWLETGDDLELEVLDQSLFDHWLEHVQHVGSQGFDLDTQQVLKISAECSSLIMLVNTINDELSQDQQLPAGDPYSQTYLNHLHREWVKLQINVPSIKTYLGLKNKSTLFESINDCIHALERMNKYRYTLKREVYIQNPFVDRIEDLTNRHSHVFVSYKNLGRTAWHKWSVGDMNLNDIDTNSYDQLSTDVILDLNPSEGIVLPDEYISACSLAGIPAIGPELGLARFDRNLSWETILTVVRRNALLGNPITFTG